MRKDGSYSSEALSSERGRPLRVTKAFKKITRIKSSLLTGILWNGKRKQKAEGAAWKVGQALWRGTFPCGRNWITPWNLGKKYPDNGVSVWEMRTFPVWDISLLEGFHCMIRKMTRQKEHLLIQLRSILWRIMPEALFGPSYERFWDPKTEP